MPEYYIDPDKVYRFPLEISVHRKGNSILVIAPETANWIVLSSYKGLEIFEYLRQGNSVGTAVKTFRDYISEVKEVITQIEARNLCDRKVVSSTSEFRTLHLYVTNKCNLACPHCYMFSGKKDDNELLTEEIIKLFKDYRSSGGENVTLSGGEPTTRPDFKTLVKSAFSLGLKVRILTNGALLTKEMVTEISPYLDSVQVSLDGFSEETNSSIRGRGHFNKALETVDELVHQGVNTSVAITPPYDLLENYYEEYARFAKALAGKYYGKSFLIKFSEGLLNGRDICPSKEVNEIYYNLMRKLQGELHGPDYEIKSFVRSIKHNVIMDNCMFGVFAVASNGDVYLCARIGDLKAVANVRTTEFSAIVELAKNAEKVTLISHLKPCNTCDLRYICGGGCRIDEFRSLVDRSDFYNIDYDSVPPRSCNPSMKEKFYALMIESNPYLFSELSH